MDKKISIVIPVYNVEDYLNRCVDSVLAQTYKEPDAMEIFLVDDGSTDRSGEICDAYAKKDARVCVIHQANQGLSAARNAGTMQASAEYITYLDSDDFWHKDFLKIMLEPTIKKGADLAIGDLYVYYEGDPISEETITGCEPEVLSGREAVRLIVEDGEAGVISASAKIYKTAKMREHLYPVGKLNEDEFVTYKAIAESDTVLRYPVKLLYYFQRKNSIMHVNYSLRRLDKLEALREAVDYFSYDAQLQAAAKLRYALSVQIAYYRVRKEMDGQQETYRKLRQTWKAFMQSEKKIIRQKASLFDRLVLDIFRFSPSLYCVCCKIILRLQK
ncbi:MAG: glycosyltransferase family 2 protein [Lachnospiraceae bacterium]|nr:glycosyltransferase family 2 protein [Lachnospiraceae bacterium]